MLNEHQQQQIRQEAIDELVNFGTPDAITQLVRRLGVNFRDTIKNEQEKKYVANILVEHFGPSSIEPMIEHIRTQQNISSVILTLGRIMPEDKLPVGPTRNPRAISTRRPPLCRTSVPTDRCSERLPRGRDPRRYAALPDGP